MLLALSTQQDVGHVEIVIVDSGSSAPMLDTIRSHCVRVVEIPSKEFSHSHARNLGARNASGELLLFSVQDALPRSSTWLREMTDGLRRLDVAALSCREEPRPDADLFYRVMSWAHTGFLSPAGRDVVMATQPDPSPVERRRHGQLSDVACLIRREVFEAFQYRGDYAEDLDLGLRLTEAGHRLAFLTSTAIVHSHHRPAYYHLRRGYVDQRALLRILPGYPASMLAASSIGRDIVWAYLVTDHLARRTLARWHRGVTLEWLADASLSSFAASRCGVLPAAGKPEPHEYIDDESLEIVRMLGGGSDMAPPGGYDGAMLHAMPGFLTLAFEYLAEGARPFDAFMLEEFKSMLYKAWAFQSGVVMAGSRADGRGAPAGLSMVHHRLGQDI
jgi:hypothetical protein